MKKSKSKPRFHCQLCNATPKGSRARAFAHFTECLKNRTTPFPFESSINAADKGDEPEQNQEMDETQDVGKSTVCDTYEHINDSSDDESSPPIKAPKKTLKQMTHKWSRLLKKRGMQYLNITEPGHESTRQMERQDIAREYNQRLVTLGCQQRRLRANFKTERNILINANIREQKRVKWYKIKLMYNDQNETRMIRKRMDELKDSFQHFVARHDAKLIDLDVKYLD